MRKGKRSLCALLAASGAGWLSLTTVKVGRTTRMRKNGDPCGGVAAAAAQSLKTAMTMSKVKDRNLAFWCNPFRAAYLFPNDCRSLILRVVSLGPRSGWESALDNVMVSCVVRVHTYLFSLSPSRCQSRSLFVRDCCGDTSCL